MEQPEPELPVEEAPNVEVTPEPQVPEAEDVEDMSNDISAPEHNPNSRRAKKK